jgi:hypothetical protein
MLQATSALMRSLLPAAAPLAAVSGPAAPAAAAAGGSGGSAASSASASGSANASSPSSSSSSSSSAQKLSADQELEVAWLESRDREVRAHEAAHQAAGGALVSGLGFQFQTGPDGRSYAIGGDVTIDVSIVPGNPQATVAKMRQVRDAALAPAQPSAQDEMVAAQAEEQELAAEMAVQEAAAATSAPSAPSPSGAAAPSSSAAAAAPAPASGVLQGHMIAAYAAAQATAALAGTPPPLYA